MSAMGAIVRVPSPDEIPADGTVIPLRDELPTVEPVQQSASELGPVSPELALVDPELARAARERLPDPRRPIAVAEPAVAEPAAVEPAVVEPAVVEHLQSSVEPAPELSQTRRRRRLGLLASAAGIIALGVLLTLLVGRDELTGRQAQQTQSVAAAVSPSVATVTKPEPAATKAAEPANSAGPSTTPAKAAPVHATAVPGKTFIWVKSPDAAAYEFQLFEGSKRIFRARVEEPRLELPGRWRQAGRPHALLPGSYRWYVWTIDKRTNRPSAKPTVGAKLIIDK